MKAFRFIDDNTLMCAVFNYDQILNCVRHTFHSKEPCEREKIVRWKLSELTQCKSLLFLRVRCSVLLPRNSVLNLFSVKTIELTSVRFSLIPSTARVNELWIRYQYSVGRESVRSRVWDKQQKTSRNCERKALQSVRLAKVNS